MPDGIHCGPFNVSGSVGLHVRSGISAVPTADLRIGQVFAQVDGHLGYIHPSGTAYTLTPPGVASSGVDGLWQRQDSNWIRPINQNYGITVNSGTEAKPSVSLPIGEPKGLYAVGGPPPFGLIGISFEGLRAITFADLGDGAGVQAFLPKHQYGPDKPRLAGEGTSGTGLYFPSNSGIGLSSEGIIGLEINRQGLHMQARMPAGVDDVPGIAFADHHHAGLQLPDAGDGINNETGQVEMLIGASLQKWSGVLITNERDTLVNGKTEIVRASTGVTLVRQRSVATNDDPTHETFQGRAAFTEDNVAGLYSFVPVPNTNYTVKALVTVRQTTGAGAGTGRSFEIIAHVQNIGGARTVTQVTNVSAGTLIVTSCGFSNGLAGLAGVELNIQVEALFGSGKSYVAHAHIQRFGPTGT